jgi:hypothetical protein
MVSFPLQTRCARGVNHLSLIGHRVDPKLIAKSREYRSWVESVGASKSKRGDPVRFSAAGENTSNVFTTVYANNPDRERFLQCLVSRFLCFAPISYMLPQNSCRLNPIYQGTNQDSSVIPFSSYLKTDRLMKQVERVLVANQLTVVTKEVVETARQNLIIGFN